MACIVPSFASITSNRYDESYLVGSVVVVDVVVVGVVGLVSGTRRIRAVNGGVGASIWPDLINSGGKL